MSHSHVLVLDRRTQLLWSLARWVTIALVPVLLVLLMVLPKPSLAALWYVIIPVLPASFFISPALWRGVCPLATLNEWGNRLGPARVLPPRTAKFLSVGGLLLFHLMVPARRFWFNQDAAFLVVAVAVVAALAVVLGALFASRSAFCNALCPVLPVELLYGQRALVRIERGRCSTCTICTPRGCVDLAAEKALSQLLGPNRRSAAWLRTPLGAFFAALPGFIVGYNLVPDGAVGSAGAVYAATLGWSVASYAAIVTLTVVLRLRRATALALLAAAAGGLYYWFAGPSIAKALSLPALAAGGIRWAGLALIGYWLWRRMTSERARLA